MENSLIDRCNRYKRICKIRAPCCNKIYCCHHCHNESIDDGCELELVPQAVTHVVCLACGEEQPVSQVCRKCNVRMGEYFCDICKLFDDESKQPFHCDDCGICRVNGRGNSFHCNTCQACYEICLRDGHKCVENSMKHECAICRKNLFNSVKRVAVMDCGHTMHHACYLEMILASEQAEDEVCCPICRKSDPEPDGFAEKA